MISTRSRRRVLPGFGLSLGFTLLYLSLIVLVPLSALAPKTASMGWAPFWATVTALHVEILYKEYNFQAAFAVASLLAFLALVTLLAKSFVEWRSRRAERPVEAAREAA